MNKNAMKMTKKEFLEIENFYNGKDICSFIIVPTKNIHDSGFRCMKYILLNQKWEIIGAVGGYSDVVHLNGIGGYGKNLKNVGKTTLPIGWSIDCLPKSGLVRLFCERKLTIDEFIYSDFMIYAEDKK